MVGEDEYAVLVDASKNSVVPQEARVFMAQHEPPQRKATAIVCKRNLAMLFVVNFYLKVEKPHVLTRLFQDETEAVEWLKIKLGAKKLSQ